MKGKLLVLLVGLVAATLLASTALAAGNPYFGVMVGATWVEDAENDYGGGATFDTEFDTGYNVGAAVGYDFGMGRLEGEIAYRQNDFDKVDVLGIDLGADGDTSALSFMVNAYWDIETGSPVTPYLGGGIGMANVSINDFQVDFFGDVADDDDTVFAYQLAAGVGFEVAPSLVLDLGYRYFATEDPEFEDDFGDKFDSEYATHNASVGLRMNF